MRSRVAAWRLSFAVPRVAVFAALLALALLIPALGLDQQLTGPMVNALLIASVPLVGLPGAIMVGAFPSLVASLRGQLPLPLVVMVPYIILGNAVMVSAVALLRRRGYWLSVVVGAVAKFALLYAAVTYLVNVPAPLAVMMQWPQLYTALMGGVIVWAGVGLYGLRRK
ncbi:MAG: ECF transporter S component [Chloroflexota bacterium]